ncbi:MAG: hypothetical protein J0I20_32570 [Chloroflexi bacterium]|nr:hypothetical protein [Chloroflexota bacterium]OJV92002.1 MAG: hypothetical protein BGO39_12925 [Chloroflexi bacterium 54-19]
MKESGEIFSYTAKRSDYLSIVIAFVILVILEAIGVDLLIALLVHGWLKYLLLFLAIGVHIWVLVLFWAPLFTKHRLSGTHLHLRYSYQFRADLPRSVLAAAEPVKEKLDSPMVVKPIYHKDRERLNLPFSTEGQVLLYLAHPVKLRLGLLKRVEVGQVLVNVDRRDLFLKMLALPAKPGAVTGNMPDENRDLIPG